MKVNAALRVEGAHTTPVGLARSIVDLMEEERQPLPCWIGPALLPKSGKALVGGEAKIGKTFLGLEMGRALATGTPMFGSGAFEVTRCRCLYVDQEVGEDGLRKRALQSFVRENREDLRPNFYYLSKRPGLYMDTPEGYAYLDHQCAAYHPNVLLLDPASRLMAGEDGDNTTVRRFWENIDRLIDKYKEDGLSVLVMHHFRKPPQDDLDLDDEARYDPYNFRGASEWVGAPDTVWTIVRPARASDEVEWLLGGQFITRHGVSGNRIYLKVAPDTAPTVREIAPHEAHAILDGMREARAALMEERKAKGGKGRKSNDAPWGRHF